MQATKIRMSSAILGRDYHADLFELDDLGAPRLLALLFGGSGVSAREYAARGAQLPSVFDEALTALATENALLFCYITAPFDLAFNAFDEHPDDRERWNRHVADELLSELPNLPLYLMGYSGGAVLALSGLHEMNRCFGVGALGADGLTAELVAGPAWREPLVLYYNRGDPVYRRNEAVIRDLEQTEVALCFRRLPGGHAISDYLANESLAGLLRRACRLR